MPDNHSSISIEAIDLAAKRMQDAIRRTPILRSQSFEKRVGSKFPIYFKVESLQHTGSFKVRGALNKLLSLSEAERSRGVITASAGNHAQGVAFHSQRLGISAKIVMPISTPIVKTRATKQLGAEIVLFGESYQEAYEKALDIQKQEGRVFVHGFDDELIIIGQGTIGKEILEDAPDVSVFVCPIGGGGLISGCASYLKAKKPSMKVIGVQAEGCSTLLPSLAAGKPVTLSAVNTMAEGISAKRLGDLTFAICKKLVDECLLVSDEEIAEGLLWLLENERLFVEGCGAVPVAAVFKKPQLVTGPTAILLSGGNLDVNFLARMIERGLKKSGRLIRIEATIPDVPGSLFKLLQVFADQKASIVNVEHERIFGKTNLREVYTRTTLETQGPDHATEIENALKRGGWTYALY